VEREGAPSGRGSWPSVEVWAATSPITSNNDEWRSKREGRGRHLSKRGWPLSRMPQLSKRGAPSFAHMLQTRDGCHLARVSSNRSLLSSAT
jgi:hypothetical protein